MSVVRGPVGKESGPSKGSINKVKVTEISHKCLQTNKYKRIIRINNCP